MNFTREQVATLRRLIEVSEDRMSAIQLTDVERLVDVLDAQLDMDAGRDILTMTDEQLDALERQFQRSLLPF